MMRKAIDLCGPFFYLQRPYIRLLADSRQRMAESPARTRIPQFSRPGMDNLL